MDVTLPTAQLVAVLLASVRAAAWLVVAPPFASRGVPGVVKALLSVALALPLVPRLVDSVPALDTGALATAVIWQVVIGASLGFLCQVLFTAVQMVGDLIDLFGGFSLAPAYDPLMLTQAGVMGRAFQTLALTLLFATNGHLLVIQGFLRTYDVVPLDGSIAMGQVGSSLVAAAGQMMLSAVQVAAPIVAVLFLADVGLGLLTRIAPALNPFALGFPLKILLALLLVGAGVATVPELVRSIAQTAARAVVGTAS